MRTSLLFRTACRTSALARLHVKPYLQVEVFEKRLLLSGNANPLTPIASPEFNSSVQSMSQGVEASGVELLSVDLAGTQASTGATIRFQLTQFGRVSAGVVDDQGHLVRTLLSMSPMAEGTHSLAWDGLDDLGRPAREGDYSIQIILNRGTYENVGAIGSNANSPSTLDHIPTTLLSVAVDQAGSIYTANGWDEAGAEFKKWNAAGETVYNAGFKVLGGNPNGAPYLVATDDTYMYLLVGAWSGQQMIQRFRLADGSAAPYQSEGPSNGHISILDQTEGLNLAITSDERLDVLTTRLSSLAVSGNTLFVSDPLNSQVLRYDKSSGQFLGAFAVEQPRALGADAAGRIWVAQGNGEIRVFSPTGSLLGVPASGLVDVSALAFGKDGRLYVADRGAGQVKVFELSGIQARWSWSLGQRAQPGDRDASRFYSLQGVAVDADGNIVTIQNEPVGGARLARWNPQGELLWEAFSNEFVSLGNYGQENPELFYSMSFHRYELTDPETGAWEYLGNTFPGGENFSRDAHGVPRVLSIGGNEYFFDPTGDGMQIYRIDGPAFHLVGLVGGNDPAPNAGLKGLPAGQWTWSDVSGTGLPSPGEINWFQSTEQARYATFGMDVDRQGNIWFVELYSRSVWMIPMGLPDTRGNPTYDWANARAVITRDTSTLGFLPQMAQRADDGSIYVLGWSDAWPQGDTPLWMGGTTLAKYDATGRRLWFVELPEICTGMDTIPGTGGVMLGGARSATVYHYSTGGLRIGSMSPGNAMGGFSSWLDNQASVAVSRDPRDGLIDVFTEDNYGLRIGWYRVDDRNVLTFTIGLSHTEAPPTTPEPEPEPPSEPVPTEAIPQEPNPALPTAPVLENPTIPVVPVEPRPVPPIPVPVAPIPTPPIASVPAPAPVPPPQAANSDRLHSERLVIPSGPPPAPEAPALLNPDGSMVRGGMLTTTRRPTLVGTTVPGGVVELVDARGLVMGMSVASALDGSFTIQPASPLKIGRARLRFRVRDTSGRQSPLGALVVLKVVNRVANATPDVPSQHATRINKSSMNPRHLALALKAQGRMFQRLGRNSGR